MASSDTRLEGVLDALDAAQRAVTSAIDDAKEAIKSAQSAHEDEIEEKNNEIQRLKAEEEESLTAATDAAHRVCDALDRPVGKLTFDIPRPDEFNRAMLGLHDAIGRKI
jgi:chromosome segregation ATPase